MSTPTRSQPASIGEVNDFDAEVRFLRRGEYDPSNRCWVHYDYEVLASGSEVEATLEDLPKGPRPWPILLLIDDNVEPGRRVRIRQLPVGPTNMFELAP